ncbi:MAG: hypothetical protein Q4E91_09740, partial [Lachnospiraceae bacterium]|nr:hypothetical protein [Lachnospiraceae bacterium]
VRSNPWTYVIRGPSSLKAKADGLLAGHSGYAYETTTGMRKQGASPEFRIPAGLRKHNVRSNPWTYVIRGPSSLKAGTDGLLAGMKV